MVGIENVKKNDRICVYTREGGSENMKKSEKTKYSFFTIINLTAVLMAVLCLILLMMLSFYLKKSASDRFYAKLDNTIETNDRHLWQEYLNVDHLLVELPYYSADFSEIIQAEPFDQEQVGSIVRLQRLLQGIKPGIDCVDGLFIYFSGSDRFLSATEDQNKAKLCNSIRDSIRERMQGKETLLDQVTNGWELGFIEDEPCVMNMISHNDSVLIGAFSLMDTVMEKRMLSVHEDYQYYLLEESGSVIWQSGSLPYPDPSMLTEELCEITCDGERYCAYLTDTDYSGIQILCLFPVMDDAIDMKPIYLLSTVILSVFFLFTGLIWMLFRQLLIRPFVEMEQVNQKIMQVEKVPELTFPCVKCREIDQSLRTVEYLCRISLEMQKNYYEEKQTRTKAELDKYKTQVAPHFLVNCLYALQNLADSGYAESEVFSMLISTLSEHLRYTLSDQEEVSLREELYYVENYLKLTQVRFPLCLDYEIEADEEAKRATVFTLMVLMFTENSIKYNMVMGNKMKVTITCARITEENHPFLTVTHRDSGKGYPEEVLEKLKRREPIKDHRGNHIGLLNVIRRLELMYPESEIRFYNDQGAVAELKVPYLRMEEKAYDEFTGCG